MKLKIGITLVIAAFATLFISTSRFGIFTAAGAERRSDEISTNMTGRIAAPSDFDIVYSNSSPISINDSLSPPTPASLYPSNIVVSGISSLGHVTKVTVRIKGFSHPFPDDVDMLLVAPNGARFVFWSDAGGGADATDLTIKFDDSAGPGIPDGGTLSSGTYRPADFSTVGEDRWPATAPCTAVGSCDAQGSAPTGAATFATQFNGMSAAAATGTWSLYVVDDTLGSVGSINGGWELGMNLTAAPTAAGQLAISEFRLRGPNGVADEYIEIQNMTDYHLTVQSADNSSGVAVASSDGAIRCVIPNNTELPIAGHFLCANSFGYSLSDYASPDDTYFVGIPDNVGLAIFNNSTGGASFSAANRIDAVGPSTEANALYREGAGYPPLSTVGSLGTLDYAFVRRTGQVSSRTVDTNDNAADFLFVDATGANAGAGRQLGSPGPENTSSPTGFSYYSSFPFSKIDPACVGRGAATSSCAVSRNPSAITAGSAPLGTIDLRVKVMNNTGGNVTRFRCRIVDLTTFPTAPGAADLRAITGPDFEVAINGSVHTVLGNYFERSQDQPNGGGINSTLSTGTITLGTPIPPGGSIYIDFKFGVVTAGSYRIKMIVESNPGGSAVFTAAGHTEMQKSPVFDFDGDGRTDIGIYRPNGAGGSEWWLSSSTSGDLATQFGSPTDRIVPADYTGDGKTDIAFWRPSTGFWYILRSEDLTYYAAPFGTNGDVPAPGDYDADAKADQAVFRPSNSIWYISKSGGGTTIQQFGLSGDLPVAADYDGDGRSDIAIYRPGLGQWWIVRSTAGTVAYQFGGSTDKTVQGDYTGDGRADVAIWRPSSGEWFILRSEDNSYYSFPFGASSDLPAPGDYDGDGRADAGVFRPSNSTWFVNRSGSGTLIQQFGQTGDLPLPNAFVR